METDKDANHIADIANPALLSPSSNTWMNWKIKLREFYSNPKHHVETLVSKAISVLTALTGSPDATWLLLSTENNFNEELELDNLDLKDQSNAETVHCYSSQSEASVNQQLNEMIYPELLERQREKQQEMKLLEDESNFDRTKRNNLVLPIILRCMFQGFLSAYISTFTIILLLVGTNSCLSILSHENSSWRKLLVISIIAFILDIRLVRLWFTCLIIDSYAFFNFNLYECLGMILYIMSYEQTLNVYSQLLLKWSVIVCTCAHLNRDWDRLQWMIKQKQGNAPYPALVIQQSDTHTFQFGVHWTSLEQKLKYHACILKLKDKRMSLVKTRTVSVTDGNAFIGMECLKLDHNGNVESIPIGKEIWCVPVMTKTPRSRDLILGQLLGWNQPNLERRLEVIESCLENLKNRKSVRELKVEMTENQMKLSKAGLKVEQKEWDTKSALNETQKLKYQKVLNKYQIEKEKYLELENDISQLKDSLNEENSLESKYLNDLQELTRLEQEKQNELKKMQETKNHLESDLHSLKGEKESIQKSLLKGEQKCAAEELLVRKRRAKLERMKEKASKAKEEEMRLKLEENKLEHESEIINEEKENEVRFQLEENKLEHESEIINEEKENEFVDDVTEMVNEPVLIENVKMESDNLTFEIDSSKDKDASLNMDKLLLTHHHRSTSDASLDRLLLDAVAQGTTDLQDDWSLENHQNKVDWTDPNVWRWTSQASSSTLKSKKSNTYSPWAWQNKSEGSSVLGLGLSLDSNTSNTSKSNNFRQEANSAPFYSQKFDPYQQQQTLMAPQYHNSYAPVHTSYMPTEQMSYTHHSVNANPVVLRGKHRAAIRKHRATMRGNTVAGGALEFGTAMGYVQQHDITNSRQQHQQNYDRRWQQNNQNVASQSVGYAQNYPHQTSFYPRQRRGASSTTPVQDHLTLQNPSFFWSQ